MPAFRIEAALRFDRILIGAALVALSLVSWAYMVREARAMVDTGVCRCLGMAMSGPDTKPWTAFELIPLSLMWAEMMVAMMTPSAAPMILTFAQVNRKRRELEGPYVSTAFFLLGYLLVWTAFSVCAAVAQWALHSTRGMTADMTLNNSLLGGWILVAAGLFQFSTVKRRCLEHCRSPLSFLLTEWREGWRGALTMGVRHGAYCMGCCWILMALLFVAGVMNLLWIAVISILVLVEKISPAGHFVGKASGAVLMLWGILVIANGLR